MSEKHTAEKVRATLAVLDAEDYCADDPPWVEINELHDYAKAYAARLKADEQAPVDADVATAIEATRWRDGGSGCRVRTRPSYEQFDTVVVALRAAEARAEKWKANYYREMPTYEESRQVWKEQYEATVDGLRAEVARLQGALREARAQVKRLREKIAGLRVKDFAVYCWSCGQSMEHSMNPNEQGIYRCHAQMCGKRPSVRVKVVAGRQANHEFQSADVRRDYEDSFKLEYGPRQDIRGNLWRRMRCYVRAYLCVLEGQKDAEPSHE